MSRICVQPAATAGRSRIQPVPSARRRRSHFCNLPTILYTSGERIPAAQRTALVDSLLAGKSSPSALRLIHRLAAAPRGRSVLSGVEELSRIAAAHRERITALVTAAIPLTEAQRERLSGILARSYGREIRLNVELDQDLIGGMVIRIGDDIIDGSVAGRLAEASRRVSQ